MQEPAVPGLAPVELYGEGVTLLPLTLAHVPALTKVGLAPELWRLQPSMISDAAQMRAYVEKALQDQAAGMALPFVIVEPSSRNIIGSTRYFDIALAHRRLEIGATWITPSHQRSKVNTETKLLLLTHAFERLQMRRIVFKTEAMNVQSRAALLRIGAIEEGCFRQHLLSDTGRPRDMVYFSMLADEWPSIKARLSARLQSPS